jgi:ankyrin repeat protein
MTKVGKSAARRIGWLPPGALKRHREMRRARTAATARTAARTAVRPARSRNGIIANLLRAIRLGNINNARAVLNESPNTRRYINRVFGDPQPRTFLAHAIMSKRVNIARLLINRGANINSNSSYLSMRPLFVACLVGMDDIAKLLIAKGASINAKNDYGETALHAAVKGGNIKCLELLIRAGADMRIRNNGGQSALDLILSIPDVELRNKALYILLKTGGVNRLNTNNRNKIQNVFMTNAALAQEFGVNHDSLRKSIVTNVGRGNIGKFLMARQTGGRRY